MRRARLRAAATLAAVAGVVALGGCGGPAGPAVGRFGKDVQPLSVSLPTQVLGLDVAKEDVKQALAQGGRSYVNATSVYSFRKQQLLEATLQVAQLADTKQVASPAFRQEVVASVGGSAPQLVHLDGDDVWITSGNQQQIALWFRGRYLFILAIRGDFDQPRTLLRQALEFAT